MKGLLSPALVLAAILSTTYAAVFHIWRKGDTIALRRYLTASWLGFALGHILSAILGIHLWRIGDLFVVSATIGALAALSIAKSREA